MQQQIPEQVFITTEDGPNMNQRTRTSSVRSPGMRILTRVSSTSIRRPGASPHGGGNPAEYAGAGAPQAGHFVHPNPPRSLDYYGFRVPYMPPQSTPMQPFNVPSHHETFGSQIDYNLSWMPQDVHQLSDAVDANILMAARARKALPAKYLQKESNATIVNTVSPDSKWPCQTYEPEDSRFLLNQSNLNEEEERGAEGTASSSKRSPKRESLLEWFDRTVENELHKRREGSLNIGENLVNLDSSSTVPTYISPKQVSSAKRLIAHASASGIDIAAQLEGQQDTELLDAIDKLAKAEAICAFEGAVQAAEQAAASAPPEYAEEAAAASALGYQAEITNVVKQELEGVKPIEVVGYVGITRPKKPKKSNVDG